ncbi:ABC transporter ATP-binding protein [Variovorax sp. efr-133-TYG-130]|uniref:ABC transporter ATP-binding protein n=1 Tax=Variovorax sp. efr-133-TYG-130 TaxID=3040327 RepID=UPI002556F4C2|nr:ABC transporter ATP-binding protein [Variovorax sp. efr-133-TYG-130]
MRKALEVVNLNASYGSTSVLHGITLHVGDGEAVALLGANGAGKTTTLRAICQMLVRTSGEVKLFDQPIRGKATEQIARLGVGHVPDGRGTFLALNVEENLRLGCFARSERDGVEQDIERIYEYFPRLKERRTQQAGTLSGGEQQMLAIGRALMARPKLLLLDEPSFGLAPLMVKEIFSILRRICHEQSVAILLVEQNAGLSLKFATRAYVVENGRVVLGGTSDEVRSNDAVRRAYLGD